MLVCGLAVVRGAWVRVGDAANLTMPVYLVAALGAFELGSRVAGADEAWCADDGRWGRFGCASPQASGLVQAGDLYSGRNPPSTRAS